MLPALRGTPAALDEEDGAPGGALVSANAKVLSLAASSLPRQRRCRSRRNARGAR